MGRRLVLLACVAALAACNKGPDINVKNATASEVAEKVREAGGSESFVDPGKWQTKVTVLDMDLPGMPPQMQQQMKQAIASREQTSYEVCLSEADVKKPKEDFFAGRNKDCRYDHFTMSGGKIDAALTCPGRPPETVNMAITGTYSRDRYEATMAMNVTGSPDGKGMKLRSHAESHRIGQCTAEKLKAKEVAAR